ncbi:hypothetical protein ALP05_01525 [Pseudomonas caricapapayae]|uniref:YjiS-like domain-containing protein n=2 Tax=Pseudomonas caricapapayae TaxID=46678 RepID=A0A3M6F2J8_9PSED|nr:hypothetical protein ALP05_01525 [Pseudomonas caricapapayae]
MRLQSSRLEGKMMKGQKGYVLVAVPAWQARLGGRLVAWTRRMRRWLELHRQRRYLAQMSDAALKDMGLSRADILEETERPFWDDPLKR